MDELNRYLMKEIALQVDFDAYTTYVGDEVTSPRRLEKLGKINVFVGANNSGKSRLIRGIARSDELVFEPPSDLLLFGKAYRDVGGFLERLSEHIAPQHFSPRDIIRSGGLADKLGKLAGLQVKGLVSALRMGQSPLNSVLDTFNHIIKSDTLSVIRRQFGQTNLSEELEAAKEKVERAILFEQASQKMVCVYIPTLRTLRDLGNADLLRDRTAMDYKLDSDVVFTGQTLYQEVEKLLRGNLQARQALRSFEEWLQATFFEGRPVALIPKLGETTLTVKIGDEAEKPIHELGDGIQSILILTFPLFRDQDKHVLAFIEEPELFLHPWLQRVLLETLATRFPKHQYFLTTHSNHFLDLTLDLQDVSVFTLEKEIDDSTSAVERPARFKVRQVSRDDRKPLELLGVRNSSVFLSNCTIWVEGITDRRYIAHWLKLYQEHLLRENTSNRVFKEDLHYSFVEYGGGNITHFSFLDDTDDADSSEKSILVDRLCGKLFLITDADGDKKKERKQKLQERLKNRYFCLPGREIENLIAPEALLKTLARFGEVGMQSFTHKSYLKKQLGKFIDDKLGSDRKRACTYSDKYGVLKSKVSFCEKANAETHSWHDVSVPAQELIQRVHAFIAAMNPK